VTKKAEDDEYLKNQQLELIKDEKSESEAFDKGMLLLNTGAIGASLLLLGNVFSKPLADSIPFLLSAWAAFAISAIGNVTSHAASAKAFRNEWENLQKRRLGREPDDSEWWKFWRWRFDILAVSWLNKISWLALLIGVSSLLYFGYLNVQSLKT